MGLTREEILERLRTDSVTLGTSRTAFFSAISSGKIRYVVAIFLFGDGVSSRTVDIEKLETDGETYTMKFNDVPVSPAGIVQLPLNKYDVENPILVLEGGTRLYGTVSGGAGLNATIIYWDNEL